MMVVVRALKSLATQPRSNFTPSMEMETVGMFGARCLIRTQPKLIIFRDAGSERMA